jgi:hypothetical protein
VNTSNIAPHGTHAAATTRDSRATKVAGCRTLIWRDASPESVGPISDITVVGCITATDSEDGAGGHSKKAEPEAARST